VGSKSTQLPEIAKKVPDTPNRSLSERCSNVHKKVADCESIAKKWGGV